LPSRSHFWMRGHKRQQQLVQRNRDFRTHKGPNTNPVVLRVSNLSDFDLWINQVRLIVTKPALSREPEIFGGANQISRGSAEEGYPLFGRVVKLSGDQTLKIDVQFYVEVEAVGMDDKPVTVRSPEYELQVRDGAVTKLEVVSRFEQQVGAISTSGPLSL